MSVILINPPAHNNQTYIREGRCMQATSSWGSLWMPISLAYTAAYLRKYQIPVRLIDCQADNLNLDKLLDEVGTFNPKVVVINTGFPSIKGDILTLSTIKNSYPEISTVALGMYPTLLKSKMLEEYSEVDYGIVGEPEWVAKNLVTALENNLPLNSIRGLVYRNNGRISVNESQVFEQNDINDLPFPARDLLNNGAYRHVARKELFTHINIARGCIYKCTFCNAPKYYGANFRKRDIESIISEISHCVNDFGIKMFVFWSEEYTLDSDFAENLADALIQSSLKITWFARARVDNVNIQVLTKMKASGCAGISLGIESSDANIHKLTKKGISIPQISKAINLCKEVGIKTTGHFVFGLPGDTYESASNTIRFAKTCGIDYAQFYCAVPYPGTKFGEEAAKKGWVTIHDYSKFQLAESVTANSTLNPDEIMHLRHKAYKEFYSQPRFWWESAVLSFRHRSITHLFDFSRWAQ